MYIFIDFFFLYQHYVSIWNSYFVFSTIEARSQGWSTWLRTSPKDSNNYNKQHDPEMSNDHKKGPGGHYPGANPIPNIQRFIQSLDADKKERDRQIEEQMEANGTVEIQDHKADQHDGISGTRKTATDPTTGRGVEIEDVNADFMEAVENPQVSTVRFVWHILMDERSDN